MINDVSNLRLIILHLGNLVGVTAGDLLDTEGRELLLKVSKLVLQLGLGLLAQIVGFGKGRLW